MEFANIAVIARIQQTIAFILLVTALAWAAYFGIYGPQALAPMILVLIVGGYAGVIRFEFLLLAASYSRQDPARPSARSLWRAWRLEVTVAPEVFLWRQPFRSRLFADSPARSPSSKERRGVILIHGFFCNRGLWNPWMQRLHSEGIPFIALTLEPIFGSIDGYATQIEAAIDQLTRATGKAPVVLAHSMGGLAVRAWLRSHDGLGRLHHVVTIGAPHRGTSMARRARPENVRQMRIGSPWLANLSGGESSRTYAAFTCFWSRCDNIVFPTDSATLPGAANHQLDATPHVAMAYHPEVFAEVLRRVRSD